MNLSDWFQFVRTNWKKEEGQTMAEYGVVLALITVLIVGTLTALSTGIRGALRGSSTSFSRDSRGAAHAALRIAPPRREGGERDSNPRPPGPQPGALPTELPPPRSGTSVARYEGGASLPELRERAILVQALGELLDHLLVEGGDVVGLAARDDPAVDDDLRGRPRSPPALRMSVCEGRPRGERAPPRDAGLDEHPRAVADHRHRLLRLGEGANELDRVLVAAQLVGVADAARDEQRVVVAVRRPPPPSCRPSPCSPARSGRSPGSRRRGSRSPRWSRRRPRAPCAAPRARRARTCRPRESRPACLRASASVHCGHLLVVGRGRGIPRLSSRGNGHVEVAGDGGTLPVCARSSGDRAADF